MDVTRAHRTRSRQKIRKAVAQPEAWLSRRRLCLQGEPSEAVREPPAFGDEAQQVLPWLEPAGVKQLLQDDEDGGAAGVPLFREIREPRCRRPASSRLRKYRFPERRHRRPVPPIPPSGKARPSSFRRTETPPRPHPRASTSGNRRRARAPAGQQVLPGLLEALPEDGSDRLLDDIDCPHDAPAIAHRSFQGAKATPAARTLSTTCNQLDRGAD